LPIREGEDVRVTVRRFDSADDIARSSDAAIVAMRLVPTSRSELA